MDDPTFVFRLLVGVAALVAFAWVDLRKHGRFARRWKELSFLGAVAVGAVLYALGHDVITRAICPEYYSVGKGIVGARAGFGVDVAWLAARAGWTAGLFVGVVLIIANNPTADARPQLAHRSLARCLAFPLLGAISFAAAAGLVAALLARRIVRAIDLDLLELDDPRGFVTVWAIHAGSYAGVLLGSVIAAVLVRAERSHRAALAAGADTALSFDPSGETARDARPARSDSALGSTSKPAAM